MGSDPVFSSLLDTGWGWDSEPWTSEEDNESTLGLILGGPVEGGVTETPQTLIPNTVWVIVEG